MMWEGQAIALFEQERNWSLRLNGTVISHSEQIMEPEKGSKTLIQSLVYLLLYILCFLGLTISQWGFQIQKWCLIAEVNPFPHTHGSSDGQNSPVMNSFWINEIGNLISRSVNKQRGHTGQHLSVKDEETVAHKGGVTCPDTKR